MKRVISLMICLLPVLATAQAPDVTTWDVSPMIITTDQYIFMHIADPYSGAEGFVIYVTPRNGDDQNRFLGVHIRQGETCYNIGRDVRDGRAVPVSYEEPCTGFIKMKRAYLQAGLKYAKPLEKLPRT